MSVALVLSGGLVPLAATGRGTPTVSQNSGMSRTTSKWYTMMHPQMPYSQNANHVNAANTEQMS